MTGPIKSTVVSTKGQVILPKSVRDERGWSSGTRLVVENTIDGVLLKEEESFAPTRFEDVYGCLKYDGPSKTVEEMDAGIVAEIKRRHDRGRY